MGFIHVPAVKKTDVGGLGHTGSTVYVPIVYASVWEAGSTLGRLHGVAYRSGRARYAGFYTFKFPDATWLLQAI